MDEKKLVVTLEEVGKQDTARVGGKGANLGELIGAGIQVPPGFVVTADSYYYFSKRSGVEARVREILESLNVNDGAQLRAASSQIQQAIMRASIPPEVSRAIRDAYKRMGGGYVAVRSSATVEDLAQASFAGQLRSFLNVKAAGQVIDSVRKCWASLFEPRAIFYMAQQEGSNGDAGVAVVVQKMVQSDVSGIMFTVEPVSGDATQVCIEAIYGLGEAVVSGAINPDRYAVDKKTLAIRERHVAKKEWKLVRNPNGKEKELNIKTTIPFELQDEQVVDDKTIVALARLGIQIEEHYGFPQDVEWACEDGRIYVVQARPVTTTRPAHGKLEQGDGLKGAKVLLLGLSASPGIGAGRVVLVEDTSQLDRVGRGDVLVAPMTTPDFVPAMKRAVAIVTDRGGRTCHAAIVSRELGVPCVVGTEVATTTLTEGQMVTVDGSRAAVYEGKLALETATVHYARAAYKTRTRVYVNLAQPHLADQVARRNVDGVGLLRAEFMVGEIGEHPRYMLSRGRGDQFIEKLAQGVMRFTRAFYPRPVVYRTTDFKTNEYRMNLKGGEMYEWQEENPMLGYRGASRYISDPATFKLEIEAIKRVRSEFDNLWVMIPFVRTIRELVMVKKLLEEEGLERSDTFKLWMMAEVPSNVILLEKFIDVGLDGISIGSNDLTQLVLGVDRDNERFKGDFDERNEAVMWALERAISIARSKGITSSICGQAPSDFPELAEKLIELGITSVSINPDVIDRTRDLVAQVEERLGRLPPQDQSLLQKSIQHNKGTSQEEELPIGGEHALMAYEQATEVAQPGEGTVHPPAV